MHGNQNALSDTPVHPDDGPVNGGAALWLGLPAARDHFDPSVLTAEDRARFLNHRGARRQADFEVSRALLAFANVGAKERSLTHSAEHAALLVAPPGCRTGVDLEFNRPRDVLRLSRFAFHEREAAAVAAAAEPARSHLFYTLWTLKEAFAKALQLELVEAIRRCVFWNDAGEWRGEVPTTAAWSAAVFQPRLDIFLAVACIGGPCLSRLSPWEWPQWEWPPQQRAEWPLIAYVDAPATPDAAQG